MSREPLNGKWELARAEPGSERPPDSAWTPISGPMPVAACLREQGKLGWETKQDLDAHDWWYRCVFPRPPGESDFVTLGFDGLATVAEAWLNGEQLLKEPSGVNMFSAQAQEVGQWLKEQNTLLIQFHALKPLLAEKRPRPRWKTRMVEQQNLRWFRTSLLGRMPGWTPPVAPVGPWRPIWLERSSVWVDALALRFQAEPLANGSGRISVHKGKVLAQTPVDEVVLEVAGHRKVMDLRQLPEGPWISGEVSIPAVERWWPHTHGVPRRYPVTLHVRSGDRVASLPQTPVAFRTLERTADPDGFGLRINGVDIFLRGAAWTPLDVMALTDTRDAYRRALMQCRDAGMNMLRLSGTLVYECDDFHDLCDELGILVWQDFMFANMDYPVEDRVLAVQVAGETVQTLTRVGTRPSTAVLCGNSEVEQQASMRGLPEDSWHSPFFHEQLPLLCKELAPGIPYLSSTPSGGALPFHVNSGVGHYYGVGAYRRPPEDARRANVRFASECLAFSNVPEPQSLREAFPDDTPPHTPRWKERVPRDSGAPWDFEDIRDHYLGTLFGVDPLELRASDPERYLALSRVVPGELMLRTFSEWRREESVCSGGLIWYLRDLWPGAGMGVVDVAGVPKASWYFLRRVFAPRALLLVDEGVNGLVLHAVNDGPSPVVGRVRYTTYREGDLRVTQAEGSLNVMARSQGKVSVDALVGHFTDSSYAYRFGPPGHDVCHAEWLDETGASIAEAFHFPLGLSASREAEVGLTARARADTDGRFQVQVQTRRFAHWVSLDAPGFIPSDGAFHLAPGQSRQVTLTPRASGAPLRGTVTALNARTQARIVLETGP